MTVDEATVLCRRVRALCPAQSWEAETPVMWASVLADVPFADAAAVLPQVKRDRAFVDVSDIAAAVRALRASRTRRIDRTALESDLPDGDVATLRARMRAVMDGATVDHAIDAHPPAITGTTPSLAVESGAHR